MVLVSSILLLGLGSIIVARTFLKQAAPSEEFPRYDAPARWKSRTLTVIVGVAIALGGAVMLLTVLQEQSAGASS